jgi:hypothetical protein
LAKTVFTPALKGALFFTNFIYYLVPKLFFLPSRAESKEGPGKEKKKFQSFFSSHPERSRRKGGERKKEVEGRVGERKKE